MLMFKTAGTSKMIFSDDQFRNQGKNGSGHYFMSRHVQRLHHFFAAENSQPNQNEKPSIKLCKTKSGFYGTSII